LGDASSTKDLAVVHTTLREHRVRDQNLFKMTADQVTELIERIKEGARRHAQERWITSVASAAYVELRRFALEEDQPEDMRSVKQRREVESRADLADAEARMDAGGDVDEVVPHWQQHLLERLVELPTD
jgi:hypothetical protein